MKKINFFALSLSTLALVACGNTSSTSVTPSSTSQSSATDTSSQVEESSTSSTSTKEENAALENALKALKVGFQAKASYKVSQYNSASDRTITNFAKEVILKNDSTGKVYGERSLSFRADGALKESSDPFNYYYDDNKGNFYQENLTYDNKIIADYRTTGDSYFDSLFSNPFELLDSNNFYYSENNTRFFLSEGASRYIASWFGTDMANYTNRNLNDNAYFTLNGDKFSSFTMEFSKRTSSTGLDEVLSFNLTFVETGDEVSYTHTSPLSEDSVDRTTLTDAFAALKDKSYTMEYVLTPDEMRLASPIHEIYYFDGDKIFIDKIAESSVKGLNTGDGLLLTNTDGTMKGYTYGNNLSFNETTSLLSGLKASDYLPKLDTISPLFFNKSGDKYVVDSRNVSAVYNELQPLLANATYLAKSNFVEDGVVSDESRDVYFSLQTLLSSSAEITIVDGLPQITVTYVDNSMGFGGAETITIKFKDVGSTTLPEEVRSKLYF